MKDDDQTLRVSTPEQTTGNQVQEITASGFHLEPHRIVTETISGGVAISQRPEFARLADRLEAGDVLVVTKLDRLGRNAMDVAATAAGLDTAGIKAHRPAHDGIIRATTRRRFRDLARGKRGGQGHPADSKATNLPESAPLSRGRQAGGETGIRTLETGYRLHAFQACAFDHSATSPNRDSTIHSASASRTKQQQTLPTRLLRNPGNHRNPRA